MTRSDPPATLRTMAVGDARTTSPIDRELLDPLPQEAGPGQPGTSTAAYRRLGRLQRLALLPPNFFAIPFGIAGLAVTWRVAASSLDTPGWIADALFVLAAVIWSVLTAGLVLRLARTPRAVADELRDPVLSPFMALPPIIVLLLAAGLQPHARSATIALMVLALAVTLPLGGWLTARWMTGATSLGVVHPAYFLPTVAGGFLVANVAGNLGFEALGWLGFGIGLICWMQLGSVILNRLFTGPPLPTALVPTLAIEVAPPAVAGNAYFALHHGPADPLLYALGGFCVLTVAVQVALVPTFRSVPFGVTSWAFTFSYTAVATFALHWLALVDLAGEVWVGGAVLAAVTGLVVVIAAKSLRAIGARRFFPA